MDGDTVTYVVLSGFPTEGMDVKYAGTDKAAAAEVAAAVHREHEETLARVNARRAKDGRDPSDTWYDETHVQEWVGGVRVRVDKRVARRDG